jgi:thiol-disulfide isomerase/thioredoxin
MKRLLFTLLILLISACTFGAYDAPFTALLLTSTPVSMLNADGTIVTATPTEDRNMADLPTYGTAPEFSNTVWLNTSEPLRLADLRGRVVLLEFWTFDCINCQRTIPYVQRWHETYASQGLVVIGNHYPEYDYEHDIQNVQAAMYRLGITYPVAQDNDATTWRAYNQRYWPTIYLVDKWGAIRYFQIGEGAYIQTEDNIQALLAERYSPETNTDTATERRFLSPTSNLSVRSGAGAQFDEIGLITPNMVFVVMGEENGWYVINYNGRDAYVSGEYVNVGTQ